MIARADKPASETLRLPRGKQQTAERDGTLRLAGYSLETVLLCIYKARRYGRTDIDVFFAFAGWVSPDGCPEDIYVNDGNVGYNEAVCCPNPFRFSRRAIP